MSAPLFQPFRALGYITDSVPYSVQRLGRESFVTVSVGKSWQVRSISLGHIKNCVSCVCMDILFRNLSYTTYKMLYDAIHAGLQLFSATA